MESTLPVTDTKYWYTMPRSWTPCYHCGCHSKNNQFKFFQLPNTASNDIQHVNSANSGDVDIRNLTVTLIRTVVLQRSWYQMPGCSVQMQNEQTYPWLYDSVVHQGCLCKFCELFCGHSSSSQECVTAGINLGTVWLLFYYWTSKLINVLLFPSFPNSHPLRANFPKYKGPAPQIQMSREIIDF